MEPSADKHHKESERARRIGPAPHVSLHVPAEAGILLLLEIHRLYHKQRDHDRRYERNY